MKRATATIAIVFALGLVTAAGALTVDVTNFSPWLYVCVTLLALFLGFGKRRHEITLLNDDAAAHRSSLGQYNLPMIDQIIGMIISATLIASAGRFTQ